MARLEFINALNAGRRQFFKSKETIMLKRFVKDNMEQFFAENDDDRQRRFWELYKDCEVDMEAVAKALEWQGVGLFPCSQANLLNLLYEPCSSKVFQKFLELLRNNGGAATAVYIAGKKAVVLTNKASVGLDSTSYRAVKSMAGSVPDLRIIPWPAIKAQQCKVITEV